MKKLLLIAFFGAIINASDDVQKTDASNIRDKRTAFERMIDANATKRQHMINIYFASLSSKENDIIIPQKDFIKKNLETN